MFLEEECLFGVKQELQITNISSQTIGKNIVIFKIDESKIDTINAQQLFCQINKQTRRKQEFVLKCFFFDWVFHQGQKRQYL